MAATAPARTGSARERLTLELTPSLGSAEPRHSPAPAHRSCSSGSEENVELRGEGRCLHEIGDCSPRLPSSERLDLTFTCTGSLDDAAWEAVMAAVRPVLSWGSEEPWHDILEGVDDA